MALRGGSGILSSPGGSGVHFDDDDERIQAPLSSMSMDRLLDTPSQDRNNRERGLAQKYANSGQITSLMLRNIPSMYTQDMLLLEIIDCMGSSDNFDFFYLPWDLQNECNVGYAFINFRDVASAERCTRIFTNFNFRKFDSRRSCRVYPAHIQGLENNLRHLMDRAVSEAHSHYPIIMWKGEKLKLGKVIAAMERQQRPQQPPRSAPGRSQFADSGRLARERPQNVWPPPQPMGEQPAGRSMSHRIDNLFGDADVSELGQDNFGVGMSSPGGDFRSRIHPPSSQGSVRAGQQQTPIEIDFLQAMPGLRAALTSRRFRKSHGSQDDPDDGGELLASSTTPTRDAQGRAEFDFGMLNRQGGPGLDLDELLSPSFSTTPQNNAAAPQGIAARKIAPSSMPGRLPGSSPSALNARDSPHVMSPSSSMGFPARSMAPVVKEIGIKDPDLDVLQKFCSKFS